MPPLTVPAGYLNSILTLVIACVPTFFAEIAIAKCGFYVPEKAQYDASYRTTAAFLAYVTEKHDPKLVTKLNALLREGKYDAKVWKTLTGKDVEELNRDWKESLAK